MSIKNLGRIAVLQLLLAVGLAPLAHAGNPATISVTVTIQSLSVSATGPIAFGTVVAGTQTVSGAGSTVTNDGNVIETFSLSLTNPSTWTAVQAAPSTAEDYALLAEFNSSAPAAGSFTYANHAISTASVASSATKFAGDQNGLSIAASGTRSLWFRFNAPTSTSVTTQQSITVTVTASAG
ncbi:MAG: hypothetical protein HYR74_10265 [Candidatus Eisenbacteria bacterium]|nr:hypothetical protein [Candidatus Eisenbacteria bacterium]